MSTNVEMTPVGEQKPLKEEKAPDSEQKLPADEDMAKPAFGVPEFLSKNKRKKLERQKKWLEGKAERRQKERQKEKDRREKKRKAAIEKGILPEKKPPVVKMEDSKCKVTIVIDCDYGKFMGEDLMRKFCKQLTRCYSSNRSSNVPVQFYLTSVAGTVKENLETYQPGHVNWDCHVTDKHWNEVFLTERKLNVGNLLYLSGDSPNNIPEPKEIQESNNHVFIIGGLLDHNQHKGLSLKRAQSFGIKHGKLPIGDHIKMCQRKILSIPHVFDIMTLASNGTFGQDWGEIFQKVIPARKISGDSGGTKLKVEPNSGSNGKSTLEA